MRSTVEVPLVNLVALLYVVKKGLEEQTAKEAVNNFLKYIPPDELNELRENGLKPFFNKFITDEEIEHYITEIAKVVGLSSEEAQLACLETKIFRNKLGIAKEENNDQPKSE